jgi:hypothetical protein
LPPKVSEVAERAATTWFDRHPGHESADARRLSKDREQLLAERDLRRWAAVSLPAALNPPIASPVHLGKQRHPEPAPAGESLGRLPAREAGGRAVKTPPLPASDPSSFPEQERHSSQLELLVRKWRGNSQTENKEEPWVEEGRRTAEGGKESGSSRRQFSPASISAADLQEGSSFSAQGPGPFADDQAFTETLERVLQREIRRHGLEEER